MSIGLYLYFNGNCREAAEYYSKVFHAPMQKILTYGEVPSEQPLQEEAKKRVMHTFLEIEGMKFMMSDVPPEVPPVQGNNISIMISSKNIEEIKSWFGQLKENGIVEMELQETFFSKCYGFVTDKFGIRWQLNFESH